MSPRSQELLDGAQARLAAARSTLEAGFPFTAVGEAYYALLYAARAALSEEELYAKTHSGTWSLFRQTFVATGRLPAELVEPVEQTRERREAADYEAQNPTPQQAAADVRHAEAFVTAVAELLER